jgi:hypothetical protein
MRSTRALVVMVGGVAAAVSHAAVFASLLAG